MNIIQMAEGDRQRRLSTNAMEKKLLGQVDVLRRQRSLVVGVNDEQASQLRIQHSRRSQEVKSYPRRIEIGHNVMNSPNAAELESLSQERPRDGSKFYAILDVETSGFHRTNDAILQLAITILTEDGATVLEPKSWLVKPPRGTRIHPKAAETHKLKLSDLLHHPAFEQVWFMFLKELDNVLNDKEKDRVVLVGHNAVAFDIQMVAIALRRNGIRFPSYITHVVDTLKCAKTSGWSKAVPPLVRSNQLGDLVRYVAPTFSFVAHDARADVAATSLLFKRLQDDGYTDEVDFPKLVKGIYDRYPLVQAPSKVDSGEGRPSADNKDDDSDGDGGEGVNTAPGGNWKEKQHGLSSLIAISNVDSQPYTDPVKQARIKKPILPFDKSMKGILFTIVEHTTTRFEQIARYVHLTYSTKLRKFTSPVYDMLYNVQCLLGNRNDSYCTKSIAPEVVSVNKEAFFFPGQHDDPHYAFQPTNGYMCQIDPYTIAGHEQEGCFHSTSINMIWNTIIPFIGVRRPFLVDNVFTRQELVNKVTAGFNIKQAKENILMGTGMSRGLPPGPATYVAVEKVDYRSYVPIRIIRVKHFWLKVLCRFF